MLRTNLTLLASVALMVVSNVIVKFRATHHGNSEVLNFVQEMLQDKWMWVALVATGSGLFLYILTIRKVDLSYAQPILALVFVLSPFSAFFILGEPLPPLRVAGLLAMTAGILLIAASA